MLRSNHAGQELPCSCGSAAHAYQRVDSHTLKGTVKKAGKVVTPEAATFSADGKTLTGTYSGTDATGEQMGAMAVLDRQ